MKKLFLMVFVCMISLSTAYADEEIQLAAVMSASGSSNIQKNKRIYASDFSGWGSSSGYTSTRDEYEFGILAGVAVAAAIAVAVDGGSDSTSSH